MQLIFLIYYKTLVSIRSFNSLLMNVTYLIVDVLIYNMKVYSVISQKRHKYFIWQWNLRILTG